MPISYRNCNALDEIGKVPEGVFRLTFVPQNAILPDEWLQGNWATYAQEQLDRISDTPYMYAIQGAPTVVDDPTIGRSAVIDVQPRDAWSGIPLEVALDAINDGYANAQLFACEAIAPLTQAAADDRAQEQTTAGVTDRTAYNKTLASTKWLTALKWACATLVVVTILVVALKVPKRVIP